MDGLFVVKNCWTSASELTVAGEVKFVEAEETFVHKGADAGGTPSPRTHGVTAADIVFVTHQREPVVHEGIPHQLHQLFPHQPHQADGDHGNL